MRKRAQNASGLEIAAYLAGGPLGIVSAMRAHPYIVQLYRRRRTLKVSGDGPQGAASA